MKSDDSNLVLAESQDTVDELNARFYGQFPFPWRPMKFDSLLDPDFQTIMLNQNLGDWQHRTLMPQMKIWVAGCGTNQAVITALNFPQAQVVGSDLSRESLELGERTAGELGLKNLELRCESINHVPYAEEFDYIICDGVIMINADPAVTLRKLVEALKRQGIMELMVYNRYERLPTTAFQKAIRLLGANSGPLHFERDLARAKKIASDVKLKNFALHQGFVEEYPDCLLADLLILPVENSYTVESFEELTKSCGLELLTPCCDMFDNPTEMTSWNMTFTDPELQSTYDALSDCKRWQITNHLMFERSPQLWFYFQRSDSRLRLRKDEKQICEEFLDTRFVKAETTQKSYIRQSDDHYKLSPSVHPYPVSVPKGVLKQVAAAAADGQRTMREIFEQLEIETTPRNVNQIRLQLTTSAFPHLKAVQNVEHKISDEEKKRLEASNFKKFKNIKPKGVSLPVKGE